MGDPRNVKAKDLVNLRIVDADLSDPISKRITLSDGRRVWFLADVALATNDDGHDEPNDLPDGDPMVTALTRD